MFSIKQKREIAAAVQQILRATNGAVINPEAAANPWNEQEGDRA